MKVESVISWGGWLITLLAVAVCLGIATLLAFGYRATREWQHSSEQLIERDTEESADLIATALTRDMQGAQSRVLANRDWDELPTDSLSDTTQQRSEEHTSELQSRLHLVCRLLLEKKKNTGLRLLWTVACSLYM